MRIHVCLHIYTFTLGRPGAYGIQKRASDPTELELWRVVSHHEGLETEPRSSDRTSAVNHRANSIAPNTPVLKQNYQHENILSTILTTNNIKYRARTSYVDP